MARPSANLRLFVAIFPDPSTVAAILELLGKLDIPSYRARPAEQVHATVQFIGDTPSADLDATVESVRRSAAGLSAFAIAPSRLITLPERGPARLVAAELQGHPTLMEVHRRLVTRLAHNVRSRDAERYRPHLTLCRFRSPARGVRLDVPLDLPPFAVNRIALMRSTLSSSGAIHHEVASCELE